MQPSILQQWRELRRQRIRALHTLHTVKIQWAKLLQKLTPRQRQQICDELNRHGESSAEWGLDVGAEDTASCIRSETSHGSATSSGSSIAVQ